MKSLTIRLRILMSFGLILAVMMTVGVAAWLRLSSIEREAAHVQGDAIPGLVANEAFKDALTSDFMLSARSAAGGDARASHDALRDTLGLCATQACGPAVSAGTDAEPLQLGKAAANAVEAALLAGCGFTSSAEPLEGRRGMFAVMGSGA